MQQMTKLSQAFEGITSRSYIKLDWPNTTVWPYCRLILNKVSTSSSLNLDNFSFYHRKACGWPLSVVPGWCKSKENTDMQNQRNNKTIFQISIIKISWEKLQQMVTRTQIFWTLPLHILCKQRRITKRDKWGSVPLGTLPKKTGHVKIKCAWDHAPAWKKH